MSRKQSAAEIANALVRNVTPPVILRLGKALLRSRRTPEPFVKPDPKDYSAIDNPVEVAIQKETYFYALNQCVAEGDRVLDVGCGSGFGLNLLAIKASEVIGAEVDPKAIEYCRAQLLKKNPKLGGLFLFDGYHLPFNDKEFDVVTCIEVIEHVEYYEDLIAELLRVAGKRLFLSTPNRRREFTNPDGTPRNYWHRREWSYAEFEEILRRHASQIDWNFLNGAWEGPFTISPTLTDASQSLLATIVCPS